MTSGWIRIWAVNNVGKRMLESLVNLDGVRMIERSEGDWKITFLDGNAVLRDELELVSHLGTALGRLEGGL